MLHTLAAFHYANLFYAPAPGGGRGGSPAIIAGTLGHSALIDGLVAQNRLKRVAEIRGRWEATLTQVVERPLPGVERALVIVGSDRRGTAYGLMRLSEEIGVSPWYWWADVPVARRAALSLDAPSPRIDAPGDGFSGPHGEDIRLARADRSEHQQGFRGGSNDVSLLIVEGFPRNHCEFILTRRGTDLIVPIERAL